MQLRSKEQIQHLFTAIGYAYKPGKFNAIFNKSVFYSQAILQRQVPFGQSTVRGMLLAVQDLHSVE